MNQPPKYLIIDDGGEINIEVAVSYAIQEIWPFGNIMCEMRARRRKVRRWQLLFRGTLKSDYTWFPPPRAMSSGAMSVHLMILASSVTHYVAGGSNEAAFLRNLDPR